MFTYLKVKNFALIDDVEIDFKKGFTAFVGETGAGKSLLVDAIDLLSGTRSSTSFLKHGADSALIQGSFYLDEQHNILELLAEQDIHIDSGEEIIVQRQIMLDGRTVCKIQGVKVAAAFLRQMMHYLVDIHGQHENSTLLNNKNHLQLLDGFGVSTELRMRYNDAFKAYETLLQEQKQLQQLYNEIENIPVYEKQVIELETANVKDEEIATIDERLETLRSFNRNFDTMVEITGVFEQSGLVEKIYQIQQLFGAFKTTDEQTLNQAERLSSAYYELQDIETDIKHQVEAYAEQKNEQEKLEKRISDIFTLQKKYGDDLQVALQEKKSKLETLQNIEFEYIQLEKKVQQQHTVIKGIAKELHDNRQEVALRLSQAIMQQLKALYMDKVEFMVHFTEKPISRDGFDEVAFFIKTNVGTEFQPLNKIASGGELSRIMLAVKIVFANTQNLSTIIFDEIDTGVSGAVAEAIAKKMRIFSNLQQVFAITHLPQVLAASHHQLLIEKSVINEETHIQVHYLTKDEHELEVAKMLSGAAVSELSVQHAKELIASFINE